MTDERKKLARIYLFFKSIYPANWQTRWSKTPYMKSFAQQSDIDKFVKRAGKFESVPGHVWACIGLWMHLRSACPSLDKLVNNQEIYERLWAHDLGETLSGDVSYAVKIHGRLDKGKDLERKGYVKIVKFLDKKDKTRLVRWFDEFEGEKDNLGLEVLIARWIDNLEGDHFALTFGKSLSKHSELISEIVRKRSVARAESIISLLEKRGKRGKNASLCKKAAEEVKEVMRFHLGFIRKKKIRINLSELGFKRG
jgi:hypothetical protein